MLAWNELLPFGSFRDGRHRHRAILLLEAALMAPGASFTGMFGKHGSRAKRAYEFCSNGKAISFGKILAPAFASLGEALRSLEGGTILCLQDTTEINLSHLRAITGLGETGNPDDRGFFLHCGLASSTDGVCLGLLSALSWVRPPEEHGKAVARRQVPFDDKESAKWWKTIEIAEGVVRRPGLLVHVGDRESDIFEVFARAGAQGYRVLTRAAQNRRLPDAEHAYLWPEAESWPMAGRRSLDVPARRARDGKPARAARTAELTLRFGQVQIRQPRAAGFVSLSVILVREDNPPEGDQIEWLLLTNDPVENAAAAWTRVEWYRRRWLIEEFHNCLKTTCRAEERQFETHAHYENFLALLMLVSSRVLYLRNLARAEPDAPAEIALDSEEIDVLRAHHNEGRKTPLQADLKLRQAVRLIAMIGGFQARKGDGEPGFKTLADGYSKLRLMIVGYRLALGLPPASDVPDPATTVAHLIRNSPTDTPTLPPCRE